MQPESPTVDGGGDERPDSAPSTRAAVVTSPLKAAGGISWPTFLALGVASGVFMWVFWSVFFSLGMGLNPFRILLGPGAGMGLFCGTFFAAIMAITMRPATATLPIADRGEFANRLDIELASLRYRLATQSTESRIYSPKALLRLPGFEIVARIGDGDATVVGPMSHLKTLLKRLAD